MKDTATIEIFQGFKDKDLQKEFGYNSLVLCISTTRYLLKPEIQKLIRPISLTKEEIRDRVEKGFGFTMCGSIAECDPDATDEEILMVASMMGLTINFIGIHEKNGSLGKLIDIETGKDLFKRKSTIWNAD